MKTSKISIKTSPEEIQTMPTTDSLTKAIQNTISEITLDQTMKLTIIREIKSRCNSIITYILNTLFHRGYNREDPNGAMYDWLCKMIEERCLDDDIQEYLKREIDKAIMENITASANIIAIAKTKKQAKAMIDRHFDEAYKSFTKE